MAAPMAVQWRSASTRRWEIKPEINWQSVIRPHHPPRRTRRLCRRSRTSEPAPAIRLRRVRRRIRPRREIGFTPGTTVAAASPVVEKDVAPPPGTTLRWINSRVFQLTYDTRALGAGGSTGVELWGTRDGGKTWQSFGADAKGQSPMLVTVPEEGIYGFQMKLLAGGPAGRPPLSGEAPRYWIGVDLTRPTGRITQARQGAGRDADKLFITWEAGDNRAGREAHRPVLQRAAGRPLDADRRRLAQQRAVHLAIEGQFAAAGLSALGSPRRGGERSDVRIVRSGRARSLLNHRAAGRSPSARLDRLACGRADVSAVEWRLNLVPIVEPCRQHTWFIGPGPFF